MFRICNSGCKVRCPHRHFPKIEDFVSKSKLLLLKFILEKPQKNKSGFEIYIN